MPECCHYDRKATFEEVIATKKAETTEETQDENQENTPKTDSVEENSMKMEMPVSYTHLDVYKRQIWWWNETAN